MSQILPLDRMSLAEKFRAMEELWEDLSRSPESIAVADWHKHELASREQSVASGKSTFEAWDAAKKRLLDKTR